jgi:hypothetical protein
MALFFWLYFHYYKYFMQIMPYQYLTNLTVEVDNLRKFIETVPGEKWHYWINPRGKQVELYNNDCQKLFNINNYQWLKEFFYNKYYDNIDNISNINEY